MSALLKDDVESLRTSWGGFGIVESMLSVRCGVKRTKVFVVGLWTARLIQ